MTSDADQNDARHDRRVAAVFGLLILGLMVFVVGIQLGLRQGGRRVPEVRTGAVAAESSRVQPAAPVVVTQDPIWQQPAEQALLRDQMLLSCEAVEVAAEISRADAYREAAVGVNAGGSLPQRQLYALGAVASELWLSRCLRWFGSR